MAMRCPECGERAEYGRPNDAWQEWARQVDPERMEARHKKTKDALCPTMTQSGYQPALPTR